MTTTRSHRYPGVRPFETHEKHLFFGRKRDIEELHNLILLEKLVVLFGKSGYGKSSLLKAGILPLFTDPEESPDRRYIPLEVRFGAYVPGKSVSPLEAAINALSNIPKVEVFSFLAEMTPNLRLWHQFKLRQQGASPARYLLVFDQFEEFFSYPEKEQAAFRAEIAEILYEETPQDVRIAARHGTREQRELLAVPFDTKVVFSIRSDRLALLDGMKDKLPAILLKRYELGALDERQAREAVIAPAALPDPDDSRYISPPFQFAPDALDKMVSELSGKGGVNAGKIEAFQLQIVCSSIEKRVTEQNLATVTAADLPDFGHVYEDYYKDRIGELGEEERKPARRVLENGLLLVNPLTGEARRLSRDAGELAPALDVQPELLTHLERTYLIRRDVNSLGGYNYEISHDTLIAPMLKARREREAALEETRKREEQLEAERRTLEAEEKARAETERRIEAERLRNSALRGKRRAQVFASLAAIIAIAAIVFYVDLQAAKSETDEQKRQRLKAEIMHETDRFARFGQDARAFVKAGYPEIAAITLDSMFMIAAKLDGMHSAAEILDTAHMVPKLNPTQQYKAMGDSLLKICPEGKKVYLQNKLNR